MKITVKGGQPAAARRRECGKMGVGPLRGAQVKLSGPLPQ